MDNGTNSTIPFNMEIRDMINKNEYAYIKTVVICVIIILNVVLNSLLNVNSKEYSDVKVAVVCVIITLNVIMNSLVIAVIARYPQLREDRTTLFMFSLSMSDLAAGCTFMPTSAALCSGKFQGVANEYSFHPKIHALTMHWFGFNSIHSLCWLTIVKTISILTPFRVEQLLPRKCCYIIIAMIWIVGCSLATVNFT